MQRLRTGKEIFLDIGCAFAQDIRRLVADGADSSKCYGMDLRLEFLDLGYELFRDKETLKTRFIEADIFEEPSPLVELYGKVDIINASSFFHLFSWDESKIVAQRCLKLFTGKKNNLLLGRQVGNSNPGEYARGHTPGMRYRHNVESWRRFWTEIGQENGIEFEVNGHMTEEPGWMTSDAAFKRDKGNKIMLFSVRRIN